VVCFIGDGGTSQGAFHEAVNNSGAQRLPVVYIIVNNGWAISLPASEQTAAQTFAQKGLGNGVPGVQVDGNDMLGMRKVTEDALARARAGDGPTVIEAVTYRLSDHTTADDATRYRPAAELEAAWKIEPLLRTKAFLIARGLWDDAREAQLRAECAARIDEAVRGYQGRTPAGTDSMFDHLYARPPAMLAEQKLIAQRYGAGDTQGH
jgi:pyruvate dehydrogenase E1 component alpha subunit